MADQGSGKDAMKVVLTGATGFVGGEVLEQLLAHPRIAKVTALTRRPVKAISPKLSVIQHADFTAYPEELARELADHDACLWTLGGKISDFGELSEFERVTHGFTLALAGAVAGRLTHRFNFCYLSGMGVDPSETSTFPWEKETRHLKGRTERDLQTLQAEHALLSVSSFRPGGILPAKSKSILGTLLAPICINVDALAAAMISVGVAADAPGYRVLQNSDIKDIARGRSSLVTDQEYAPRAAI